MTRTLQRAALSAAHLAALAALLIVTAAAVGAMTRHADSAAAAAAERRTQVAPDSSGQLQPTACADTAPGQQPEPANAALPSCRTLTAQLADWLAAGGADRQPGTGL